MTHGPEDEADETPDRTPEQEAHDAGFETQEEHEDYLEDLNEG